MEHQCLFLAFGGRIEYVYVYRLSYLKESANEGVKEGGRKRIGEDRKSQVIR